MTKTEEITMATEIVEKHPYELAPQELWDKIFNWLTDPTDLTNCLNTCSTFYSLLQERRTQFLFPDAFKILLQNCCRKKDDHLKLLRCRSVSKYWKQSLDNHYQTLPYFSMLDYYAFHEEMLKCITAFLCRIWNDPFSIDFELSHRGLNDLNKKMMQWESCSLPDGNPFPSRHIGIYDTEETLREDAEAIIGNVQVKALILEMLQKFGNNIWYLTVLLQMGVPSQRYLMLREMLQFTPNLKVLSVYFRAGDGDLEEIVEENPFPELNDLVMFQGEKVPNVMLKSVLKYNPQIEKFQNQGAPSLCPFPQPKLCSGCVTQYEEVSQDDMNIARFSRLEKLSVDFHVAGKAVCFMEFTNYKCQYNLYGDSQNGATCEIQIWKKKGSPSVFTLLERFESTLVHFRFGVLNERKDSSKMTVSDRAVCADVILPLKAWSLKTLRVSFKCRDGYRWIDEKDAISQLHTYLDGRLVESAIWKLPEMKQVFVVDGCDGALTLFV